MSSIRLADQSKIPTVQTVKITNADVKGGLKSLLTKVLEVYGGKGKLKVEKKKKVRDFSFKYDGPEQAKQLLEKALQAVREQEEAKSNIKWELTFTLIQQTTTVSG